MLLILHSSEFAGGISSILQSLMRQGEILFYCYSDFFIGGLPQQGWRYKGPQYPGTNYCQQDCSPSSFWNTVIGDKLLKTFKIHYSNFFIFYQIHLYCLFEWPFLFLSFTLCFILFSGRSTLELSLLTMCHLCRW